jgi:preprotein translocase subunit SecD
MDAPLQSNRISVDMPAGQAPLSAERQSVLDERDFRSASLSQDANGLPLLRLCFALDGRAKFARVVEQNAKRRLVFLLNGKLLFAPVIDQTSGPECAEVTGNVATACSPPTRATRAMGHAVGAPKLSGSTSLLGPVPDRGG